MASYLRKPVEVFPTRPSQLVYPSIDKSVTTAVRVLKALNTEFKERASDGAPSAPGLSSILNAGLPLLLQGFGSPRPASCTSPVTSTGAHGVRELPSSLKKRDNPALRLTHAPACEEDWYGTASTNLTGAPEAKSDLSTHQGDVTEDANRDDNVSSTGNGASQPADVQGDDGNQSGDLCNSSPCTKQNGVRKPQDITSLRKLAALKLAETNDVLHNRE